MEEIQVLVPEDAKAFRDIRLESLFESPDSFGLTYEEYLNRDIEVIRKGLEAKSDSFTLGAFDSRSHLIGVIGFVQEQSVKFKHKGFIWGMYVRSGYRNQGVGRRLVEQTIEKAKRIEDLEQINLCVVVGNENAKSLYKLIGFDVYGMEKRALKHNGKYYDEELMTLWL